MHFGIEQKLLLRGLFLGSNVRTYPLSTPRIRFITKKAPRTTIETKYKNCHVFPIASCTLDLEKVIISIYWSHILMIFW